MRDIKGVACGNVYRICVGRPTVGRRGVGGRRSEIKYKEDILYTKRMSKVFFILPTCLMVLITNCISSSSEALDCRES